MLENAPLYHSRRLDGLVDTDTTRTMAAQAPMAKGENFLEERVSGGVAGDGSIGVGAK
jgi:hypothetical protein